MASAFKDQPLAYYLKQKIQTLKGEVKNLTAGLLEANAGDRVVQHFLSKYTLTPPVIHVDQVQQGDAIETMVTTDSVLRPYAPGTLIFIQIPYEDPSQVIIYKPRNMHSQPVDCGLRDGSLIFDVTASDRDEHSLKARYDTIIQAIQHNCRAITDQITEHNASLRPIIEDCLSKRRVTYGAHARRSRLLDIPIARTDSRVTDLVVPDVRRQSAITQLRSAPAEDEWQLSPAEYEYILDTMGRMTEVMERNPRVFSTLKEEDIRTFFLVVLNSHYELRATGETFNYSGDTDISIEYSGSLVFIAECKLWKGRQSFLKAIDQLLSYLSWRDTKCAILLFNRGQNQSNVIAKIKDALPKHSCVEGEVRQDRENRFRCMLHRRDDPQRKLHLAVAVYAVPADDATTA